MYSRHASVWMVKPGGTGSPALVISAKPAPLPPSSSFILPLPSALPAPKKNTYWVPDCVFVATCKSELEVTLIMFVSGVGLIFQYKCLRHRAEQQGRNLRRNSFLKSSAVRRARS